MKPPDDNDRVAELLSQTLHEEAETVDVDATSLHAIRSRLAPPRRRGWWIAGSAGVGLATAAAITAVVLIGTGTAPTTAPPAGQGKGSLPHPTPATPRHQHGTFWSTLPPPLKVEPRFPGVFVPGQPAVIMYYLDPSAQPAGGQSQLYVEPHSVGSHAAAGGTPWSTGRLRDAVARTAVSEFFESIPIDPQYESDWPAGISVNAGHSVKRVGDTTTLTLVGTADLTGQTCTGCKAFAPAALQALARTAGLQTGDKLAITYNGKPLDAVFGNALPVTVLPISAVRASVQVTSPVDGQSVTSPVTVTGDGNVFEGNVSWELLDSTGAIVKHGNAMTAQGEWRPFDIGLGDLKAGTYTIRCYEASAKDGSATFVDDKTFTVK